MLFTSKFSSLLFSLKRIFFTEIEYDSLEKVKVFHALILDAEKLNNYYLINFEKINKQNEN